jgi:hypothetical protein
MVLILILSSCGAPERINGGSGAAVPVTIVESDDMARICSGMPKLTNAQYIGVFTYCPRAIYLLRYREERWTLPHECAHLADSYGGDFARAIRDITPEQPTPEFSKRLAVLWEIQRCHHGYWAEIARRWGRQAVVHPEILATIPEIP